MIRCVQAAFAAVAVMCLTAASLNAADIDNGQKLARKCSVCHGKEGVSKDREVPNLAGQSAFYLEKTLKSFLSGEREERRMTLIVKTLSDEDVKDLAAWYSTFVLTVARPE